MNALDLSLTAGLELSVAPGGKLKIKGLSLLPPDQAAHLIDYAKEHRDAILEALTGQNSFGSFPLAAPSLPAAPARLDADSIHDSFYG